MTQTLVKQTLTACSEIQNERTLQDILTHLMTEVGELAQEIQIAEGKSYKEHGEDGVVGEAVDVINCVLDIIYQYDNTITEMDLCIFNHDKLNKWKNNTSPTKSYC